MTQYAYPDPLSALHGLVAVLAALRHRDRTGEGQHVDLAQVEAVAAALGVTLTEALSTGADPPKLGNASRAYAPHDCYPCNGEDRWCAIAVTDDLAWRGLCRALDAADWAGDARLATAGGRVAARDELDARITAWTRTRDRDEVVELLQAEGVPCGAVQTVVDLAEGDPQLAARGFFERIPHFAQGSVLATGLPIRIAGAPGRTAHAGAAVGQHTDEVLHDWLGMSDEEIAAGVAAGAIERPDPDP